MVSATNWAPKESTLTVARRKPLLFLFNHLINLLASGMVSANLVLAASLVVPY